MKHWFAFCSTAALATILATSITSCGKQENVPAAQKSAKAEQKDAGATPMEWWKQTVCYEIYPNSFMDSDGNGTMEDMDSLIAERGQGCLYRRRSQRSWSRFTQGNFTPLLADHAQIFAYKRIFAGDNENDTVTALVNLSETEPGKMRSLEAVIFEK